MKRKISELEGKALDWAVAKCEGSSSYPSVAAQARMKYSTKWALAGPIIEREWVELAASSDQWGATMHLEAGSIRYLGRTPLIAAMRCYVASKLGNTVDIPDSLNDKG